jgi:hypothetical protein
MKVFCPQHKIGFFTPRKNPIRCENRGHVLGEFIFHGSANTSVETLWQYCCNCEHFCPVESDRNALKTCPACGRSISQLYLCDRCFTLTYESGTPLQTKNFTLTADGAPRPSCPACFQECSGDLREHDCDALGACFVSAINACPICLEHLDVGPVFPSSAAQYLRKTRAAHKLNVAFDYATGLFLPADNGEFILVSGSTGGPFLLPRSTRFASRDDFYEVYQDYYHCSNVNPGELDIIEPASVERVGNGWKLQSMGVLEIAGAAAAPISKQIDETRTFTHRILAIDDEPIVQREIRHTEPPTFSWAIPEAPRTLATAHRYKLIASVVIGVLFVTLGGFLLIGPVSRLGHGSEAEVTSNLQASADLAPRVQPRVEPPVEPKSAAVIKAGPQISPANNSADEDLRSLREKLVSSSPSDRSTLLQLFLKAEEQFPRDYRFPYERAKLVINARETRSHHDAFDALSSAAERAINADKAQEMLRALESDSAGDFHKLSRGHSEWAEIIEALEQKDAKLLTPGH